MKENVFPIRKFYRVFNGDLIDGIPELERKEINPNDRVERADKFLQAWSDNEAKIYHGGAQAYYSPKQDCLLCRLSRQHFRNVPYLRLR